MIIYKATNKLNGKCYIGQTIHTLQKRKNQHERSPRYKHTKDMVFARAISKYGKDAFYWEIIDTANSIEELNIKEEYWISKLNTLASNGFGYNDKCGGNNHRLSESTKQKISIAQQGEKSHSFGKVGTQNPTSKKVLNVTDNILYESANLCAMEENLNASHVCAVCRGDRASTGDKIFRYIDDYGKIIEPQTTVRKKTQRILNITTGEIYNNCVDATQSVGKKVASNLSNALKKGNGICNQYGMIWCYEGLDSALINSFTSTKPLPRYSNQQMPVINKTTGEVFPSLALASKQYGAKKQTYLSILLKKGNGVCIWKKCTWEYL